MQQQTGGDIWTLAGGKGDTGKLSPVVIVQDDNIDATDSITICAFTTDDPEAPLFRLPVAPNECHGWRAECRQIVDKIFTAPKTKVGARWQQRRYSAAEPGRCRIPGAGCLA